MNNILVIGSSNIDLIAQVKHLPDAGETVGNANFSKVFGGKGANQAVAAARAGSNVNFVSSLGDDANAEELKKHFRSVGINTNNLHQVNDCSTGVALILVDNKGENCIAVAPEANEKLTPDLINDELIKEADIVLMQMEIPYNTVKSVCLTAKTHNIKVLLNPAPATKLDEELLNCVDYLVLNETEAELISELSINKDGLDTVAQKLTNMGCDTIILTLGKEGSYLYSKELKKKIYSYNVKAIDSTAAGDTYCGALAVGISNNIELTEAIRFATAAAAISVTKLGAQSSIPDRNEIETFINEHKKDLQGS